MLTPPPPVFGHGKPCLGHMARLPTTAETEAEALPTVWLILLGGLLPSGHSQPVQEHVQGCQISAHTCSPHVLIYTHRVRGGLNALLPCRWWHCSLF